MATSRGASSSRGKPTYSTFNPNWGPEYYKTENLESFILTAGNDAFNEYKDGLERLKAQIFERAGATTGAARQELARTGEYRKQLQKYRYDTVMRLYNEGALGSLDDISQSAAANATVSGAREISIQDVHAKMLEYNYDRQNPNPTALAAMLDWVRAQVPSGFKVNALEELARQLNVRGFSVIRGANGSPAKGPEKKQILYNMIVAQVSGTGSGRSATPATTSGGGVTLPTSTRSDLQAELNRRNISNVGALTSLRVDELRQIARQFNLPTHGKKVDIINRIAEAVGLEALPEIEEVIVNVDRLIALARQDPRAAAEQAEAMGADVLSLADAQRLRTLGNLLQVRSRVPGSRGALTATQIIEGLTGTRPAAARSRERREAIRTSREECLASNLDDVRAVAQAQGINVAGMTQAEICNALFSRYLSNLANLMLGRAQSGELARIAALQGEEQQRELRRLSQQLGLRDIHSIDDLMNKWLEAHYVARALQLRPEAEQEVRDFLATGAIPDDPFAQADLAAVFADMDRTLGSRIPAAERERALRTLSENFIDRFRRGEGLAALSERMSSIAAQPSTRSRRSGEFAATSSDTSSRENMSASDSNRRHEDMSATSPRENMSAGESSSRGRGDLVVSQSIMDAANSSGTRLRGNNQRNRSPANEVTRPRDTNQDILGGLLI